MEGGRNSALAELEADLVNLSAMELREKYKKEANSHRSMKDRCRKSEKMADGRNRLNAVWGDFSSFLRDMGPLPTPEHTLDRIDHSDPEYGPGKVKWSTKLEQTQNRKNTVTVTFQGRQMSLKEFADEIEVSYKTVHGAVQGRGIPPDEYARTIRSAKDKLGSRVPGFPAPFDPEKFLLDFTHWKNTNVVRPDRKRVASIEAYYLIRAVGGIWRFERRASEEGLWEAATEVELASHPLHDQIEKVQIARRMVPLVSEALERILPSWSGEPSRPKVSYLGRWLTEPKDCY